MDLSHTVRKILGVLTLGLGISFGQKIVHMNGTYDLDGDGRRAEGARRDVLRQRQPPARATLDLRGPLPSGRRR